MTDSWVPYCQPAPVRSALPQSTEGRARLAEIGERQALLGARFGQQVLGDEEDFVLPLQAHQLGGLPQSLRDAAAATAKERGLASQLGVTLSRSMVERTAIQRISPSLGRMILYCTV